MVKFHTVTRGEQKFQARSGQTLLDAALLAGVDYPHDCRAGRCGACATRIKTGIVLGGETSQVGLFHACQAHVFSDLALEIEPTPEVRQVDAKVTSIQDLPGDIVEVAMKPADAIEILPGQYCRFTFQGYPPRAFSPTAPLDGAAPGRSIRINVKRVRNGRVSSNLGYNIRRKHRVSIEGPLGHAYFRTKQTGRLVLVGTGSGFAPIWAIADAALKENADRRLVVVTGAKAATQLYMAKALDLLSTFPNVTVIATTSQPARHHCIRCGNPLDHLPALAADDTIHAAGAPTLVEALAARARPVGATFHSDPFVADSSQRDWISRAVDWLRAV